MKIHCFGFFICLLQVLGLSAQTESIQLLQTNHLLTQKAPKVQFSASRNVVDDNQILRLPARLNIPFRDDFSTPTIPTFEALDTFSIDTLLFLGDCIANEYEVDTLFLMNNTAWEYSYNVNTQQVDSTPIVAISYNVFNGPNCFDNTTTRNYWPRYFHQYTFDENTGEALDSVLIEPDTAVLSARIPILQLDDRFNWMDNNAYINDVLPINPLSLGVATLDGLNAFGLPYRVGDLTDVADFLTSQRIDLSAFSGADSLYLSFVYQPKGLGDFPDLGDSLVLEVRSQHDLNWYTLWRANGFATVSEVPNEFITVMIPFLDATSVNGPFLFHEDFQFRFRNIAAIGGNNDHWHIDYVQLDQNRGINDTIINDIAISRPLNHLLTEFSVMPYDHFNAAQDLVDELPIIFKNNGDGTTTVNWNANVQSGADEVFDRPTSQFPSLGTVTQTIEPNTNYNMPVRNTQSLVLNTTVTSSISDGSTNNISTNDTLNQSFAFRQMLAYDDGSAERAYGLEGEGLKKFAYQFDLRKLDTISAIQIHFTNIEEDVSDLIFNIVVWRDFELDVINGNETVLAELINQKPTYIDTLNGFATFALNEPLIVDGTVYVGWSSDDVRNLYVGYDLNLPLGRPKMFVYRNAVWEPSAIPLDGSPMIRLLLDGDFEPALSIANPSLFNQSIALYPNPVQNQLMFDADCNNCKVVIYQPNGAKVLEAAVNQPNIDISQLQPGFYLFSLTNGQQHFTSSFIKE